MATLKELSELIVDCEHKTAPIQDTGYPSIRTPNIGRGRLLLEGVNRVSEETYKRWTQREEPQSGDLILAREAPIGNVAIIPPGLKVCLGQRTVLIRPDSKKVNPHYLTYLLLGDELQGQILAKSNGATVHHFNMSDIRSLDIPPLPSRGVQERIASTLSSYDDLIENNTRRIKILKQMAQMLYREWFVNFRFPSHENVKMVESEMGLIPDGWNAQSVGTVSLNFDSKRRPLSSIERSTRKGPYPYYGAATIFDFIDDFIFDGVFLLVGEDGSVITPDNKPVLQLTDGKFWPNNHTHVLQGKAPFSTYFLYLCLADSDVTGCVTGAAQPKITQANLNRIPVIAPTARLLNTFDGIITPMFLEVALLERKSRNLKATRDLLLPKLVSGEVSVEDVEQEALAEAV